MAATKAIYYNELVQEWDQWEWRWLYPFIQDPGSFRFQYWRVVKFWLSKKGKKKHKGRMKEWKETHAWKHQVFPAPLFLGAFQNTTLHQRTRKKGPSAFKVYNILPPAVTITSLAVALSVQNQRKHNYTAWGLAWPCHRVQGPGLA